MMHTKLDSSQARDHNFRPLAYGEILWDLFPDEHRLGGAPSNVAFHLAQLGMGPTLVSRVGNDARGHRAIERLSEVGVDCSLVQVDDERQTGFVEVSLEGSEPRYHLNPGGAWQYIDVTPEVEAAIAGSDIMSFGGLVLRNREGQENLRKALTIAAGTCRRLFDINLRKGHFELPVVTSLLELTDIAKLNDDEHDLVAENFGTRDLPHWLLHERDVELVAITHGEKGCTLYSKEGSAHHPGFPADTGGDNVGAGDSFVAALSCGLHFGWSMAQIAENANRLASFVASRRGATPLITPALKELFTG